MLHLPKHFETKPFQNFVAAAPDPYLVPRSEPDELSHLFGVQILNSSIGAEDRHLHRFAEQTPMQIMPVQIAVFAQCAVIIEQTATICKGGRDCA